MEYRGLGKTGIIVSRLCFGVLTIGPLQDNLDLDEGAEILRYALNKGISFLDTGDSYGTYPYIREALRRPGLRPVIASKSYAYTWQGMKDSVERACDEMQVSHIDIFLLHEQENEKTLQGHQEALEYLTAAKKRGQVKAVGLSTHTVAGVMAGAEHPMIEVIHPLINRAGIGIPDGKPQTMAAAIYYAWLKGKGLYAMKVLGGGNLGAQAHQAFAYALNLAALSSMAVGMKSKDEVDLNIAWMEGRRDCELEARVSRIKRTLHIQDWCEGCGSCLEACRYQALSLQDEQAVVDHKRCILCGYCAGYCPNFCIKMI